MEPTSSVRYTIQVAGSTATASWANRPRALSGTASTTLVASEGTSKTKPWGWPKTSSVSSQVSQDCRGVRPPAQLVLVPLRTAQLSICDGCRGSKAVIVLPPPLSGS